MAKLTAKQQESIVSEVITQFKGFKADQAEQSDKVGGSAMYTPVEGEELTVLKQLNGLAVADSTFSGVICAKEDGSGVMLSLRHFRGISAEKGSKLRVVSTKTVKGDYGKNVVAKMELV